MSLRFQAWTPADAPRIAALLAEPQSAGLSVARVFSCDLWRFMAVFAEGAGGVLALAGDTLVGVLLIERRPVQWNGVVRKGVLVDTLSVHPRWRRQGVATRLQVAALQVYADSVRDAIVHGVFQVDNQASLDMVRPNLGWVSEPLDAVLLRPAPRPPSAPGIEARLARDDERAAFAEGANRYFAEHLLHTPLSEASLQELLHCSIDDQGSHDVVVVTEGGRVVGGARVLVTAPLEQHRVVGQAPADRLRWWLGGLSHWDGGMRTVRVRGLWFAPGHAQAAGVLLDHIRHRWGRLGGLALGADPREPAHAVVMARPRFYGFKLCVKANEPGAAGRPVVRV
ncbi:MAG: GNAT family N-acetyltransferase [Alphaproteobacteria bacterium]|nr:GNAT family N-acetyltransferase [Alphaproteobacteria bacterium]